MPAVGVCTSATAVATAMVAASVSGALVVSVTNWHEPKSKLSAELSPTVLSSAFSTASVSGTASSPILPGSMNLHLGSATGYAVTMTLHAACMMPTSSLMLDILREEVVCASGVGLREMPICAISFTT